MFLYLKIIFLSVSVVIVLRLERKNAKFEKSRYYTSEIIGKVIAKAF